MDNQEYEVVSMVVENNCGVLARVTSVFGRRGYNIENLTLSKTENPKMAKIVVGLLGNLVDLPNVIEQTKKLEEVKFVELVKGA